MKPKISVIIAAYNEERLLPRCLTALQKQTYPQEKFEIIVVNNGSKDETYAVAKQFGVQVYTYTEMQGCAASRVCGVAHAKGELIAFTDADAAPEADWLEKVDAAFEDAQIVFVGGQAVPDENSSWTQFVYSAYHAFDAFQATIRKPLMGGYNMIVRKSAYDAIGGINKTLQAADDWELSIRLLKKFGPRRIKFDPALRVTVSTRKQNNKMIFVRYLKDHIQNYINLVLLGKTKTNSLENIR